MTDQSPTAVLASLVGDVQRFTAQVWGRRSQVHESGTPATDLLCLEDVDRLVTASALRIPTFRMVRDGTPLPPSEYTTNGTIGGRRYDGVASPAKVLRALDDGATLVLQGAQRYHPPLTRLCRDLEIALGHRCQVNAYVTPPAARGLDVHCDPHDVLVLQSFGTKAWEVHPTPWQRRHEPDAGPVQQLLSPGDVQYLPKGTPHAARSQQELSGHITVGILGTTWRDVACAVVADLLAEDHDTIPAGWLDDGEAFASQLSQRLARLAGALANVDPQPVVARRARQFLASRSPVLQGGLLDRQVLGDLADTTRLRRRPGAVCRVVAGDGTDRIRLLLGDREVDVPAWVAPALQVVADRSELRPADLSGWLDAESRLVLCRRLVREGLLSVGT